MLSFANLFNPNLRRVQQVAKNLDSKMELFYEAIVEKLKGQEINIDTIRYSIATSMDVFEDLEEKQKRIEKEEAKIKKEKEKFEREEKKRLLKLEKEEKIRIKEELKKKKEQDKIEKEKLKQHEKNKKKGILSREEMLNKLSSDKGDKSENESEEESDIPEKEEVEPEEYIYNNFDFSKENDLDEDFWCEENFKEKTVGKRRLKIHKECYIVLEKPELEVLEQEYNLDSSYEDQELFVGILNKQTSKIIKEENISTIIKSWVQRNNIVVPSLEIRISI
jgi:hypothetical protein